MSASEAYAHPGEAVQAYPLSWPIRIPRTQKPQKSAFKANSQGGKLTVSSAVTRLMAELRTINAVDIIVSTNIPIRKDGLPYSVHAEPDDVGVAVYFKWVKIARDQLSQLYCLPCDRWNRVADNINAVALHINAIRGIQRWGVMSTEQAYEGFKVLPSGLPHSPSPPPSKKWTSYWPQVFRDAYTWEDIRKQYLARAKKFHPDRVHDDMKDAMHEQMVQLNQAFDEAKKYFGVQ